MVTLYRHQQELVDKFPKRHGLWHGTGVGKTITAIALANKGATSVLVVVPNLGGMLVQKWQTAIVDFGDPSIHWKIMTKEQFRKDAKIIPRYDALIWDEAHALGNPKSLMYKMASAWIKIRKPEFVWLLTATPYLADAPMSTLAYGHLLGTEWKWIDFRNTYYTQKYLGKGVIFVPKTNCQEELGHLMRTIGSTVKLSDCIDMPEHVIKEEYFEDTKGQISLRKGIMESESNPLVRCGKLHQTDSGILIGNEYAEDQYISSYKNDRVLELAQTHDKLAVFSRYNNHLDHLSRLLTEKGIPNAIINGKTKDKPSVAEHLEKSDRIVALIQMSGAVGYELPSFTAIAYSSCSYSYLDLVQSLGRFDRANMPPQRRVIYYLMSKGGMDEAVYASLKRKEDFDIALYAQKGGVE